MTDRCDGCGAWVEADALRAVGLLKLCAPCKEVYDGERFNYTPYEPDWFDEEVL